MNATDLFTLARTVYGEARGESHQGRLAVAWVAMNRFNSDKWFSADSIAGVCRKPWQFSCWNDGDPNRHRLIGLTMDDQTFRECVHVAAAVVAEAEPDPTLGSTHYYNPDLAAPDWADGETPAAAIGRHLFFTAID